MYAERNLGVAGHPGTGKTALSTFLLEQGFRIFEGSDALKAEAERRDITLKTRAELGKFHATLQTERGPDVLAQMMFELNDPDLAFIGLRSVANAKLIKKNYGILVALSCPPEIALPRMPANDPKTPKSLEEYALAVQNDNNPALGLGVDTIVAMADHTLDTAKSLQVTKLEFGRIIAHTWPDCV